MSDLDQQLQSCLQSDRSEDLQVLIAYERNRLEAYQAFGISAQAMAAAVEAQLRLLREVHPDLNQFCRQAFGWSRCPLTSAWRLWLPLAQWISKNQQTLGSPIVQGILGGQGTGKTTLTTILSRILTQLGHKVCCLSIDDFYLTFHERQQLQEQDPRLTWRGPPGTHDVDLAMRTLEQLTAGHPVVVPRFDKSAHSGQGDRTVGEMVTEATVIILEGWFVGIRPISSGRLASKQLATMPWPIETEADLAFARDSNVRLQAYVPLWNQLDRLVVLNPVDYRLSQQWRREAEQTMAAGGRPGMSDHDINRFVLYFWRSLHPDLFLTPLLRSRSSDPPCRLRQDDLKREAETQQVDLVVEIDARHVPCRIYAP